MPKQDPGEEFWSLVAPRTGMVRAVRHAERAFTSDTAMIVDCEQGPFFLKGVREPSRESESFAREAVINPFVTPLAPALRWQVREGGWIVLAFDVAEGVRPDLAPGSPDLPAVVEALNRIAALDLPPVAAGWPETRYDRFAKGEEHRLAGNKLLHTEVNASNLLVRPGGVSVVDWAWPSRGAGFLDPATLMVQLMTTGHSARSAQDVAGQCAAFASADPADIDASAATSARMYRHFATQYPAGWRETMAQAAETWADYRGVPV